MAFDALAYMKRPEAGGIARDQAGPVTAKLCKMAM